MYQPIIDAINNEISNRRLSARQMAGELGLKQQTLHRILHGERRIGGITFARIMDRRPEWWPLLNGSNNRPTGSSEPRKEQGPGAA